MARITAGVGCSHVPAIGVAMDQGITGQPYWEPCFAGFEASREWMKKAKPDVIFLVYNCFNLGKAIRRAVESFDEDLNVVIFGTGGMSHQLQYKRAGLINKDWDQSFLDRLTSDPVGLSQMPHVEYLREAGSEGVEMVMWHVMRGALDEDVVEVHRHYHVPASNTAVGHIILENKTG